MYFNPVQTNEMPTSQKIKNYIWVFINNTIFRFTPHFTFQDMEELAVKSVWRKD